MSIIEILKFIHDYYLIINAEIWNDIKFYDAYVIFHHKRSEKRNTARYVSTVEGY